MSVVVSNAFVRKQNDLFIFMSNLKKLPYIITGLIEQPNDKRAFWLYITKKITDRAA